MKFTFFWVKQSTLVSHVSNIASNAVKRAESRLHKAILPDVLKRSELSNLTVTSTLKTSNNKKPNLRFTQ